MVVEEVDVSDESLRSATTRYDPLRLVKIRYDSGGGGGGGGGGG